MAQLRLNSHVFEVQLAAFDKDGTLIDFTHLWGQKARLGVEALVGRVSGNEPLRRALYRTLGYDPETGVAAGDSPLAVTSIAKLYTIATTVLYQHGFGWHEAEQAVEEAFVDPVSALPTADLVRPLGDVAALFRKLAGAGVHIAVITSDDRAATQATLELLGVTERVNLLVCGDDDIANKPAPDALRYLAAEFGIEPARIMMVGDTVSDMIFGANADVGRRVGVLSGAGDPLSLAAYADVVVDSIDWIEVI